METLYRCVVPIIYQGALISLPLIICVIILRVCVVVLRLHSGPVNTLASVMGLLVLWQFYSKGTVYFIILCILIYGVLHFARRDRGAIIAIVSVIFLIVCETSVASSVNWHQIRGSFLVMVMRMVSLGFDLDVGKDKEGEKRAPVLAKTPNFIEYSSYCLFPGTTIFGPFVVYSEHIKFLDPAPLDIYWLTNVAKSWLSAMFCLTMSVCVMPFIFNEPHWNKWLAAYSAAASFRYSHYFVSFLSQFGILASGIGYTIKSQSDKSYIWSQFHVVHPFSIELPRSLGIVVINWNIPMHLFLKNYVYKPSRSYIGKLGAILLTYMASALLHGLNFQLAAVLLSIGMYAYIENVLRYKLSNRLDACILDRPCPPTCQHKHKNVKLWVFLLNAGFTFLAIFHLAYLGLMFGTQSQDEMNLELQGYSMFHTLRKWAHLNFLSHWLALFCYLMTFIL